MKDRDRSRLESLGRVIHQEDSAPYMETALRVVVERTREIEAVLDTGRLQTVGVG